MKTPLQKTKNLMILARTRDRFDTLLAEWTEIEDAIGKMKDEQGDITEKISELFSDIITREQLLANLSWKVHTYPGAASIDCKTKDKKVDEFLQKMIWKDFKYYYNARIQVGGNQAVISDGELTIHFENGVEDCIKFCKEQGIKPESSALNDQRKKAQADVDRMTNIIESLGNEKDEVK